jgi:hypothetical protein
MPGTFPAAAPVLTGDSLAISRFLNNPAAIARRLRDFRDLRFVSDQLLTGRLKSQGGAILYEMSEPFVTDRAVESVSAGSEYPYANTATGTAAIAAIQKWGQKVLLTDEEIARNVYGQAAVDRQLKKVINSVISQVDSITMSLIASTVTNTFAVPTTWATSTTIMRDIFRAVAQVVALNQGYVPNVLALNDVAAAYVMSDPTITNALKREDSSNPVYTGQISSLIGLTIVTSPSIPTGQAWVLDSTQLGGMGDEMDGAPGYSVSDLAVQVKSIRKESQDAWDLQGRRKTVPVIQEPAAAVRITGTTL